MAISLEFETEEQAKAWALELVKQSKREIPSNLFRDVQLNAEELVEINNNYDFVVEQGVEVKHCNNMANFTYMEHLIYNSAGTYAKTTGATEIRDLIRKLSLAVYGIRNNKDMNKKDFEQSKMFYGKIKDLFLQEYTNRLEKIKENQIESIN